MTRPPPPAAATCNLFCLRARVAGAGGGGVGSGVGTAAPQVVLVQRGPIRGDEPHALCPRRRPAPSPPLPPALPRPGLRSRYPLCGCGSRRPLTPGLPGGAGGDQGPWLGAGGAQPPSPGFLGAGTAAVAARGRGVGPGCGLWRGQAWRRRDAAAAITGLDKAPRSSLSSLHRRSGGAHSPGLPQPACPPARVWEGDGAPPPALRKSAASPSTPVAGRWGAMCG